MSQDASNRYVAALTTGEGLRDGFIYSMAFDDYKAFPDPFPRRAFTVREVETRIERYPNPAKPGALFQWDIHGRLLAPTETSIPGIAANTAKMAPVAGVDPAAAAEPPITSA